MDAELEVKDFVERARKTARAPNGPSKERAEWIKPGLVGRVRYLKGEEMLRHAVLKEVLEEGSDDTPLAEHVHRRLQVAYATARKIVLHHAAAIEVVGKELLRHDTLEGPQLDEVLARVQEMVVEIADFIFPVLARFDNTIKGGSLLKLAILKDQDVHTVTAARGRLSDELHTSSEILNPETVTHADLVAEVVKLETWLASIDTRQKNATVPAISCA